MYALQARTPGHKNKLPVSRAISGDTVKVLSCWGLRRRDRMPHFIAGEVEKSGILLEKVGRSYGKETNDEAQGPGHGEHLAFCKPPPARKPKWETRLKCLTEVVSIFK